MCVCRSRGVSASPVHCRCEIHVTSRIIIPPLTAISGGAIRYQPSPASVSAVADRVQLCHPLSFCPPMALGPSHVHYAGDVVGANPGDTQHGTTEDLEPQAPRTSGPSGGALADKPTVVRPRYFVTPVHWGFDDTGRRVRTKPGTKGGGPGRGRLDCEIIFSQSSGGPAPA